MSDNNNIIIGNALNEKELKGISGGGFIFSDSEQKLEFSVDSTKRDYPGGLDGYVPTKKSEEFVQIDNSSSIQF